MNGGKMNQKYMLGIFAFAMVAVLGVSMVSANGFGGFNSGATDEERAEMQEQREAIRQAVEDGNYAQWEGLMQEKLALMEDRINEEQFAQVQERHAQRSEFRAAVEELKESGDFSREDMQELREEYGVEGGFGKGQGKSGGMRQGKCPMTE